MSIRRQVTFPTEDVWRSIQDRAKLFGRTVGEYLSWLHAVQSKVVPLSGIPVVREDRDLTEDERSEDDVVVEMVYPEGVRSVKVNPLIVNIEEPEVDGTSPVEGISVHPIGEIDVTKDPDSDEFFRPYSKEHQTRKKKR